MYLELIAIALITIHFGTPLLYYKYLMIRWINNPWNLKIDLKYKPNVTIILPTYNEIKYIEKKLYNIYHQEYPKNRVEIIVIDSASNDGTPQLVKEWAREHPDIKLILLQEPIRRGMVPALNYALEHVSKDSEVIVFTDADAFWEADSLNKIVKYLADTSVGAVSARIVPMEDKYLETSYRNYYNIVRIGESKIHSTPVHNGPLVAFRKKLLDRIGGLPTYTGNDDSTPASLIAFLGYRAIQIDDTVVREPIRHDQVKRKIRRAQHLVLHFMYTKRYAKKLNIYRKSKFDHIWRIESFLHLLNPWLLIVTTVLLLISLIRYINLVALVLLGLGFSLLAIEDFRTWILNQLYLVIATVRNIRTKEIIWTK